MPVGQRPLIRRRLRLELRQERERARKSQAEVAKKMDWSLSKIIRLEAGQVGISTNDLKALLDLYGVNDSARRAFLVDLARSARQQSSWWTAYRDAIPSSEYADFLGYESDASIINVFNTLTVPGLLQTEEYARELFTNDKPQDLDEEAVERQVELRMARKRNVFEQEKAPELIAILDEAVLHRLVGGPEVMNDQLTSIADLAALPEVTVQIIPFAAGAHPGMLGPFQILDFTDPDDAPVIQFDVAPYRNVMLRDDPVELTEYRAIFESLRARALPENESIDMINNVAAALPQEDDHTE
jgi:transcriptional regulator with XRE-family HTH domain